MTEQEKIEALAEIFDVDAGMLSAATKLDSLEWDSVARMTMIAFAREHGKAITGKQLREAETIGDLLADL